MGWLSKLFGGSAAPAAPAGEDYNGFHVTPQPIKDGQVWRIAAKITATDEGTAKTHEMIRADTLQSQDEASAASLRKAKQMIDEQGMRLFGN
ncbi:HlyU family transcriptional regulator [Loktanella salsilacus]|uniref:HlyU family transcriptional regulator n=1 Tax=Loktanella salsilacus TaxID=195913 RepID=UPI0020B7A001|nr:HlyU family transcriptional regulator [Loktanella salsilacus]UTH43566.1 hypothetical protein KBK07_10595 [Loktanella salsilacus]